jgi:chromosome segregation ATPase
MNDNLHNHTLLKSKLKSREELIRELRAQMEADSRDYSDRIDELTRERDTVQRERDALRRECDALRRKVRALELDIRQLKAECEESRQELLFVSETPHSARLAAGGEDYEEEPTSTAQLTKEKMEGLVARLSSFFTNEAMARRYLNAIHGLRDTDVAMVTNSYWEKGAFQKKARKTQLWRVLNEAKLYRASESNWNAMVNFSRKR